MGRKSRAKADAGRHQRVPGGWPRKRSLAWRLAAALTAAAMLVGAGLFVGYSRTTTVRAAALGAPDRVRLSTSKGDIVIEVYPKAMPGTVANFERLVAARFYDGLTWHRVENWVVQTGDPTGTGAGGSGQAIKFETTPLLGNVRGAVGMARKADDLDSATSQFYILKADARSLDGQYAVFGRVVSGMDVVDKLTTQDKILRAVVETTQSK